LWEYSLDKLELYHAAALENQQFTMVELAMLIHQPEKYSKMLKRRELEKQSSANVGATPANIEKLKRLSRG